MQNPLRVLVVEDCEDDFALVVRTLRQEGYEVTARRVDSASTLENSLKDEKWNVVISDYSMPGFNGVAALRIVREAEPELPFIFLSGTIGEDNAVEAMRVGAQDYVMKGKLARLVPAIRRELREAENRREHRRAEQRMRQLEKFEAIGKLAGGIAHDFNNVIGAIMGWAELGGEQVPANSRAADYFLKIRDQSERAAGLTRQLLAYARRQILLPQNVNLNEIIADTTALLQKVIGEHIEFKTVLAPDLQITKADATQMGQVLLNLCFNARDAMPSGGQLLIETRTVQLDRDYCWRHADVDPGMYVQMSVSDTGIGMDAGTIEKIFEPFFTTKEIGKGTGLGLATVFGIVNQHRGIVDVYSEVGKGTVFHVYLPVSKGTAKMRQQIDEPALRGGNETILVAEDHEALRETSRETLEALGYKVILARNGEEAVEKFLQNKTEISLLLLDVVMPKSSGLDAYLKLSETKPNVPVIFTSGYSEEGVLLASMAENGGILLQKPYGPKILARKIRELLDKTQQN